MPCPGCLPAGVEPNRGNEETVRAPGLLWPTNGISDVVDGALSVESTSQTFSTNGHGTKTAYRRGKREAGEEPVWVSTRFTPATEDGWGDAGWDGWTHVARLKYNARTGSFPRKKRSLTTVCFLPTRANKERRRPPLWTSVFQFSLSIFPSLPGLRRAIFYEAWFVRFVAAVSRRQQQTTATTIIRVGGGCSRYGVSLRRFD